MSAPRIVIRYFEEGTKDRWMRMARVLEASIREHCPGWELDLQELTAASNLYSPLGNQRDVANTRKLDSWCEAVAAAEDGDRILLLDADTLVRRPLDAAFEQPFDLAYTVKPEEARYPFNGGVVFLRVSNKTRAFLRMWRDVNAFFLDHPLDHQVWQPPFGGINQSALGMLLKSSDQAWPERFKGYRHGMNVRRLPCLEWNCEDEHWDVFDPKVTRIVHFKSALQRLLFKEHGGEGNRALVAEWRAAEDRLLRSHVPVIEQSIARGVMTIEQAREELSMERPERNMQITPDDLVNREPCEPAAEPVDEPATEPTPAPPAKRLTRKQRRRQQQKGVATP